VNSKLIAVAVGLACAAAVPVAQATNGYMSHAYSPAAKGMAGAGEAALPQDSLSIVGNPAGLTAVGRRMDVGAAWFSPIRDYKGVTPTYNHALNPTGALAPIGGGFDGTGQVDSQNNDFLVPNLGYTHPLDANSAVGVALFGNGGMNSDWRAKDTLAFPGLGNLGTYGGNNFFANPPHYQLPDGSFGPQIPGTVPIGGGNAGINLEQLGLSLGYARDLTDNFHLGAALLLAYQTLEVKGVGAFQGFTETFTQSFIASQGRGAVSPSNLSDNDKSSSYGWGVQIGAIWDINPMFSLGASIRTKMYMSDFDDYSDLLAESGGFDMPAVGTIGLAVRPNKQLTFALDVQQIWYGDVDSIANDNYLAQQCNLAAAFGPTRDGSIYKPSSCLGGSNGAGFGWNDMTVLKLGVQYALNDTLTLRAGYSHGDAPIDGSQVAFNTLAPAVIEDHWTIGATYRMAENYELTFWGMYAPEETVSGPGAFTGAQAPEISMHQYEIGVNFGWLFN